MSGVVLKPTWVLVQCCHHQVKEQLPPITVSLSVSDHVDKVIDDNTMTMMEMKTKYNSLLEHAVCVHDYRKFKWEQEARRGVTPKVWLHDNPGYASDGVVVVVVVVDDVVVDVVDDIIVVVVIVVDDDDAVVIVVVVLVVVGGGGGGVSFVDIS